MSIISPVSNFLLSSYLVNRVLFLFSQGLVNYD